jgi:hypothetical protein
MIKNKQERKFEKESITTKQKSKLLRGRSPHSRLRHEDAIMNKHYYN